MATADALTRGREAFARRAWGEAYRALAEADAGAEAGAWSGRGRGADRGGAHLDPHDLERLATAAYLAGHDQEHATALERAHKGFVTAGATTAALRCAFWLGMTLAQRGEDARAGGWFARAARLVEDDPDRPERAYTLLPAALQQLEQDPVRARSLFAAAAELAARSDDRDLQALARLGLGQALIEGGEVVRGMALLDEVMTAVQGEEVSAVAAGLLYCAVIDACQACFDLQRAQEWTAALTDWCASQPDLVPYRGQCLVHRAELLQLHGEWDEALAEAERASERFRQAPGQSAIGAAYYRTAELHRVRGDRDAAEANYRLASRSGHAPEPGLALLRLDVGELDRAAATLRRALDEEHPQPSKRANLLAAAVEVALAGADLEGARRSADALAGLAAELDAPMLVAAAAHATGAVALAEGDARAALAALRRASAGWRDLGVPYEAARVRVRVGLACRELGDEEGAALELEAARAAFASLGARPELERLSRLERPVQVARSGRQDRERGRQGNLERSEQRRSASAGHTPTRTSTGDRPGEATTRTSGLTDRPGGGPTERPGGLTDREIEVLRLVATGRTNRAVAEALTISEHTVARHLQNVFAKTGVGSRAAAVAYAYEHDLV
jgi:ATP/maltotriose-dependent transcriptional regulator MalT